MSKCPICNNTVESLYHTKVLKKYDTELLFCDNCLFSYLKNPTWLEESYEESINITDTGASQRAIDNSKNLSLLLQWGLKTQEDYFLDYGGGHGLLTRLMRDNGWNWHWYDPYTKNILAKGFSESKLSKYSLISSFETFEHFEKPLDIIERLTKHSSNIFFSTEVYTTTRPPKIDKWHYYAPHHGQHISFFHTKTLEYIANQYSLVFYTNGTNLHLFTNKKSLKLDILFTFLKNSKWMRLIREIIFLYIKLIKTSKILEDADLLEKRRTLENEK